MIDLATFMPRRILVCQLRQLGDVLLATPALELLKRRWPEAELHLFTEKKCLPLLEGNPHLDKVWALDKQKLDNLYREIRWYREVARTGFDLVIDFQQLPRCRWVVAFSGASVRLSYTPPWYLRFLYTHSAPLKAGYAAQTKASILEPFGIIWNGERPRLYLREEERAEAQTLLKELGLHSGQRLVTLDPTHRRETRRWPASCYAEMIRILAGQDPSLRFLPLWGPGEEKDIRELVSACPPEVMLLPERMLGLREMAACIAEADLHVGNCSAPRHIAVAVDTPTCTVLGSTSATWTFPSPEHRHVSSELPCQPCGRDVCPHISCLKNLDPAVVARAAGEMLKTVCPHKH